jgi:hypothetical protein
MEPCSSQHDVELKESIPLAHMRTMPSISTFVSDEYPESTTSILDSNLTGVKNGRDGGTADKAKEVFYRSKTFAQKEYWSRFSLRLPMTKQRMGKDVTSSSQNRVEPCYFMSESWEQF